MGIFDNTKRKVSASVTRKVMGDFDNPLPGIVLGSVVTNQNLVENITQYLNFGMYSKALAYYRNGRDQFIRGLPAGYLQDRNINTDEIRRVIELAESSTITLLYAIVDNNYEEHYVRQFLQDTRGMNPITYLVSTNPSGTPNTAVGPIKYLSNALGSAPNTRVLTYEYTIADSSKLTFTENLAMPYVDGIVYQVQYQLVNALLEPVGVPLYWTYLLGAGTYTALDQMPDLTPQENGQYFPITPFYEDKLEIGSMSNSNTALHQSCKKLITRLGFNYYDIVNNLAEGTEESIGKNKGLYAYLYLGADVCAGIPKNYLTATPDEWHTAQADHQATISYLIDYFIAASLEANAYNGMQSDFSDGLSKIEPKKNSIVITDESFRMVLNYFEIKVELVTGSVGNVGWCTNEFTEQELLVNTSIRPPKATKVDTSILTYKKQLSPTTYRKVSVIGLEQEMTIFTDTTSVSYPKMAFQDEDPSLIMVPLNKLITDRTPTKYKNRLMHNSICFLFISYQIQEIKWYQQSFWSDVLQIAAIVLAIPTNGLSLSWSSIFTVAGLKAIAYAAVVMILNYTLTREVLKYVSKKWGQSAALIVGAILAVYGGKQGFKAPWADQLLKAVNSLWSSSNIVLQQKYKDLQAEQRTVQSEMDVLEKELERGKRLLDEGMNIDPWLFVNPTPDLMFSYTSDQFISTKLDANPGLVVLETPSMYHDLMLRLPTIDDTLTK